jgi:hypothetical protein
MIMEGLVELPGFTIFRKRRVVEVSPTHETFEDVRARREAVVRNVLMHTSQLNADHELTLLEEPVAPTKGIGRLIGFGNHGQHLCNMRGMSLFGF